MLCPVVYAKQQIRQMNNISCPVRSRHRCVSRLAVEHPMRILSGACSTGADDEHLDKILEAAASLPFLSAIILVANGSVPRETMNIKNVFTLLRGNMPDAVLDNTLAVFTNCNSLTRCSNCLTVVLHWECRVSTHAFCQCRNLEPKILPMRIAKKHQFYTDNSAFSTDPQRSVMCKTAVDAS